MDHVCDADCWVYIIPNGVPDGCDAFAASDAADKEWAMSPDGIIAASGLWQ